MTNEEKAFDIVFGWADDVHDSAKDAAIEMAEWKDTQFKEYLEKKKLEIELNMGNPSVGSSAFIAKDCMLCLINEIINELFEEIEQDNSDREE